MKVLVVGGGGREHALVWRLAQSPTVDSCSPRPGNAGIAAEARLRRRSPADDVAGHRRRSSSARRSTSTVVGPEAPLVAGLADELAPAAAPSSGPSRDGRAHRGLQVLGEGADASVTGSRRHGRRHVHGRRRRRVDVRRRARRRSRRHQGRRPRRGQGRGRRRGPSRGVARPSRALLVDDAFGDAGARWWWRSSCAGRRSPRSRSRDGRRRAAARAGAGLQARRRRRHGPEHRRDGRVLARRRGGSADRGRRSGSGSCEPTVGAMATRASATAGCSTRG